MYKHFFKRLIDCTLSLIALILLSPIFLIVAILVRTKLGKPIIFKQVRPGYKNKNFNICKFRTMSNERDENGKLLPDDLRLTKFGRWLRSTSLDELPQLWNIFTGKMSIIGPRPRLIEDMETTEENQKKRASVRPGLTGNAQVHGRNLLLWEQMLEYDLEYVEKISFWFDLKILFKTVLVVLKREGITKINKEPQLQEEIDEKARAVEAKQSEDISQ